MASNYISRAKREHPGDRIFICVHCEKYPVTHPVTTDEEAAKMPTTKCPFCGEVGFKEV